MVTDFSQDFSIFFLKKFSLSPVILILENLGVALQL